MYSKKVILYIGLFLNIAGMSGQVVQLIKVEYWGPKENYDDWVRIKKDGLSNIEYSTSTKTTAWELSQSGTPVTKPIAYVSGSTARISATFKDMRPNNFCPNPGVPANGNARKMFVRGSVIDAADMPTGMTLAIKELEKTGQNKIYIYNTESASVAFPNQKVQYIEHFRIKWEWSNTDNPDAVWLPAGISENRLYTTLSTPLVYEPHFYTCLHLGCSEANGKTNNQELVAKVQEKFATRCITRIDDVEENCLKYWGHVAESGQNRGLEYLLENANGNAYEDGRCGTWVDFFDDVLSIQGIQGQQITVLAYTPAGSLSGVLSNTVEETYLNRLESFFGTTLFPHPDDPINPNNVLLDGGEESGQHPGNGARVVIHGKKAVNIVTGQEELVVISKFFVKNWDFSLGENQFYALMATNEHISIQEPNGNIIQTVQGALVNSQDAQGNESPPFSDFGDHIIYKLFNQFYDPSYGKGPFVSKYDWIDNSLSGYGTTLKYYDPESFPHSLLWLHKRPSISNQDIINFKSN